MERIRVLLRAEGPYLGESFVRVVVPGWNPDVVIEVPIDEVPIVVVDALLHQTTYRCFGSCHLGAEKKEDLAIQWEDPSDEEE